MPDKQLPNLFLEQSNDLIWIIDSNFCLKYANQAYQNVMKLVTGVENKIDETIFTDGYGDGYIEKWRAYYERGLNGEHFEIEEQFYNHHTNQVEYSEITFKPIADENGVIVNVACQSRDITSFIQSNAEAEKLLDASLDVICSIDGQGNFTKVSAACKELWGYEKHELIGKAYISFVIEEDIEKTNLVAADILAGKAFTTFANRYKRKDGGIAFNLWSTRYDPKTQVMFCVARDARGKIKKEELLIESENRFKSLVQEGSDLIAILDEAGIYTYVSPTSMGILGMEPEEFIGKNPFDYIHPEDVEKTMNSISKIATESRVEVEPFRFKSKNGEWRWIETVLTNMLSNPAIKGIVANSRDITDKRKETQHLKLLESVITNTKDAVLITEAEPFDEPGPRILYVNEAFTRMTGYTAEEVIGKTPRILQGPNSDMAELARLSKAIRNWEPCEITTINYKKNGEEFWINFALTPVADATGWYTHWISIERDVTEQKTKELENELVAQISSTFNLVNDFEKATKKLCEIIGLYGKLDWVELWTPNLEMTEMRLISHYVITPEDEIFYTDNYNDNKFSKDEGLIGKVWASGKQLLWDDVTKRNEFIKADSAKKIGLKSVLGIPLIFNNKVLGVLTVGVKSNSDYLKNYTRIFERLEKFIGSELQRKTIEIELSLLFDTIPDIISVGDFQGRFLRINKPGCKLLGYNEDEILQKGFENFIHPEDLNICYSEIQKLQNGQDTFGFEVRFITKSGEILWLSWYCKAKINEGLIYCTAKNITEEKKLRELNRQSRKLAKIGSWEVDMLNQTIYWSDEVHQMHETDASSFKPTIEQAVAFYREDFRELVNQSIEKSINIGEPFDFEAVLVTANKKEVWVRAVGRAEMLDRKCTRIFGSFQDIHERKIAEQQTNSLLSTLEKSLNEIYVFDAETLKFSYVNQGALINLGYSKQEIKALTPLDLKPDFTATTFNQLVNPLVTKEKEKIIFFTNNKRKNGSLYPVEVHLQFVAEGNSKRFLAVILDITERKKAEEKLLNAFQEKTNILESIGDAFFAVDNEWTVTYWNNVAEKSFQKNKNDIVGKNLWEVYPDSIGSDYHINYQYALETMETQSFEAFYETFNQWLEVTAYPSEDGLSVYFKDITQRKKANEEIAKSEEKRRLIMNGALDAIITIDTNETITFWNAQAEVIFGWKAEEVMGKPLSEMIIPEKFRKYHVEGLKNYLKTGEGKALNVLLELSAIRRNTEEFPIELTVIPIKQGGEEFFCSFIRDIAQRKKSEAARIMAEKSYQELFDKSNDAIYIHDIDTGQLIDVNYRATELTGFDKMDLLEKDPSILFTDNPEYSMEKAIENIQKAAQGKPQVFDWLVKKKDGTSGWFEMTLKRTSIAGVDKILAFQRDITERKKAEVELLVINHKLNIQTKELQRSNEELEQFAFIASHDLQEPLRMVSSFMDQLKRKYADRLDEKGLQYIHFATDGAKRMKQIILDLLLYSRANKPIEQNELINLNEIVSEYTQLRRKVIAEKSATITFHGLPSIETYRAPITQIFHCLLDNALKYVDENKPPSIEIDAVEKENVWQFAIKDNGIGIDQKFFDKIFIIFQRLQNRKEHDGTGIGLAIVKRSIEFLGGEIWVQSEIDKGSTFYFTILKIKQLI